MTLVSSPLIKQLEEVSHSSAVFVNLSSVDILGQVILGGGGGCPVLCTVQCLGATQISTQLDVNTTLNHHQL